MFDMLKYNVSLVTHSQISNNVHNSDVITYAQR